MTICRCKRFCRRNLVFKIIRNQPDENDNTWFLKLSKQSQLDFILNRESDGELDFNKLKINTLIETNKILETMGKLKITKTTKEVKELIEMMDNQVEHLNSLVNTKKPLWKGGNLISAIESGDYYVKITVERKSKSDGTK